MLDIETMMINCSCSATVLVVRNAYLIEAMMFLSRVTLGQPVIVFSRACSGFRGECSCLVAWQGRPHRCNILWGDWMRLLHLESDMHKATPERLLLDTSCLDKWLSQQLLYHLLFAAQVSLLFADHFKELCCDARPGSACVCACPLLCAESSQSHPCCPKRGQDERVSVQLLEGTNSLGSPRRQRLMEMNACWQFKYLMYSMFSCPESPSLAADNQGTVLWTYKPPGGQKLRFQLSPLCVRFPQRRPLNLIKDLSL